MRFWLYYCLLAMLSSEVSGSIPPVLTQNVELSNGILAETKTCKPRRKTNKPPLLFVHGSFHAAWCWSEKYLPFFSSKGYWASALGSRGTGDAHANDDARKVKLMEQVDDLAAYIQSVKEKNPKTRPILLGHSMGGLVVMKYLEQYPESMKDLGGVALLCATPPSGMRPMTSRVMWRSLSQTWKLMKGMAMKKVFTDASLCRDLFFDDGIPEEDVARYQKYFNRDSHVSLDLMDLKKQVPLKTNKNGKGSFSLDIGKRLVLGANDDFIVDSEGVEETANFLGVQPVMIDSPHDIMLGPRWQNGAETILNWLEETDAN